MSEPLPMGIVNFKEFWPYYVREHSHPASRMLHVVGTCASVTLLMAAVLTQKWWLLAGVPIVGYGLAWCGHYIFERNRPATFRYPFFSLRGDFVLLYKVLSLQMPGEIEKAKRLGEGK